MITKLPDDIYEFVDWDVFMGNSSEKEYTCEFAEGEITFNQWQRHIWSNEAKSAIRVLKRNFTQSQILRRAKLWCKKEGF